MQTLTGIAVRKAIHSGITEVDFNQLEFGKHVSDHMLVCDFKDGEWHRPHIVPFANLSISPSALALHYGQTVFEGMKAFRMDDGRINIFRLNRHYDRFARSLERMCMAVPPRDVFTEGMSQLIALDREWVPDGEGRSLYIRPFVYASEARFGIKISEEYRFIIFTGPVQDMYVKPIRVKVENHYARASRGGTGFAKCGGNYGAAYYPTKIAREQGYDQVLWTDAKEHQYIEESGMMNVMFVLNGRIVTPPLSDSILDGVTRDSLITLAKDMGFDVTERPVSVNEIEIAFREGVITEAFGAGTAAVVAPIGAINLNETDYQLPPYHELSVSRRLKQKLQQVRLGKSSDTYEWNYIV
jgi:branched-chain amino acid aminotransferase